MAVDVGSDAQLRNVLDIALSILFVLTSNAQVVPKGRHEDHAVSIYEVQVISGHFAGRVSKHAYSDMTGRSFETMTRTIAAGRQDPVHFNHFS